MTDVTVNGTVLLLLAGVVIGYMATLTTDAERRLQRATELEAATRERERLARGIHDSVLQVLALVQRRGTSWAARPRSWAASPVSRRPRCGRWWRRSPDLGPPIRWPTCA
jgi:hypothetical protein